MTIKIETKVVCDLCGNNKEGEVEEIEVNGAIFNFCHDSRLCILRESKRVVERESEEVDGDRN